MPHKIRIKNGEQNSFQDIYQDSRQISFFWDILVMLLWSLFKIVNHQHLLSPEYVTNYIIAFLTGQGDVEQMAQDRLNTRISFLLK